jgi:hypothetical protein
MKPNNNKCKENIKKDIIGIEVEDTDTTDDKKTGEDNNEEVSVLEDNENTNGTEEQHTTQVGNFKPDDTIQDDDLHSLMTMMEKDDDIMFEKNDEQSSA